MANALCQWVASHQVLLAQGISPDLARFARTHAAWTGPDIALEDLLVSVADKIAVAAGLATDKAKVEGLRSKLKLLAARGWLAGVPGGLFTLPDHARTGHSALSA